MLDKFDLHFEKVKGSFPFQLRDYQLNIVQRVFSHIEEEKKYQTVMLPVGAGKTVVSQLLAMSFADAGYTVLMVSEGANQQYLYDQNPLFQKYVESGRICIEQQTKLWSCDVGHIDFVIADALRVMIDSSMQLNNVISNAINALQRSSFRELSMGQRSALGIKRIYDIINDNGAFFIEFESTQGQQISHAPVVALQNNISIELKEEDLIAYEIEIARETDALYRRKATAIMSRQMEAHQYDYYISELEKRFDTMEDRLGKRIEAVGQDVKEVLNIVNELNHKITKQLDDSKRVLSIFAAIHPEEDDEAALFSAHIIDDLCSRIVSDIDSMQKQGTYDRCTTMLRLSLGEDAWSKLGENAKKFIISAKVFLNQNIALGDIVDFSSICLLASKSYEAELSQRIFTDYLRFVSAKYNDRNDWPPALFKKTRNGEEYVLSITDVTLGTLLAIMGDVGSYLDREFNKRIFTQYCKESLLKNTSLAAIESAVDMMITYTRDIKDKYRNPAAHKDTITMEAALECMSYIIDVEKALKNTLELFKE